MSKIFAIVENGKVVNKVVAESALESSWIESVEAKMGDLYDGAVFTTPAPVIDVSAAIAAAKMEGVSILGVMCSATKDDQAGLSAVALGVTLARMAAQTFPDTRFEFANGNSLVITNANFDSVYAAWTPFRQSFFAP